MEKDSFRFSRGKRLIICDIDDVLVYTSIKWVENALSLKPIFNNVGNDEIIRAAAYADKEGFEKLIMERPFYYLNEWLGLPDIATNLFMKAYSDDGLFYDNLSLTQFGLNLVAAHGRNKYVFVTHCIGGQCDSSKFDFIARNFKNVDYIYEPVPIGMKKSDIIGLKYSDFSAFIDDDERNHIDVMTNCAKPGQEYIYPLYGFNASLPIKVEELVIKNKLSLRCF